MLTYIVIIVALIMAVAWYRSTSAVGRAPPSASVKAESFCGEACPGIKKNINGYCINR
jgi:hypothetical protein